MHTIKNILTENSSAKTTGFPTNQLDSDGYLIDHYDWQESLAEQLAKSVGITSLTGEHWQVIFYLRDYYSRLNAMPPPRRLCRQLGIEGHDIKVMFGSCLAVWRIAGLPNPGDEARAHMH